MTLAIRSFLFNVFLYLNTLVLGIVFLPALVLPRSVSWFGIRLWSQSNQWVLAKLCGLRSEFSGLDRIPAGGLIVASKHQSAWETFALIPHFREPAFILKRELMWIPILGWYARKVRMIPVDRGARGKALAAMTENARRAVEEGRQIIIFPEGTRRPAGAEPAYKYGVAQLYAQLGVPVLPVALNSGMYWPRRTIRKEPGTIRATFLPPIAPGLAKHDFIEQLRDTIEAESNRLMTVAEVERSAKTS